MTEYIEHLREKIARHECIYCEKIFADRNTLMEHMRKKNHKEVNPKNNYYDKVYFFIIIKNKSIYGLFSVLHNQLFGVGQTMVGRVG